MAVWKAIQHDNGCGYGIDRVMVTREGIETLRLHHLERKHAVRYLEHTYLALGSFRVEAARQG